MKPALVPLLLAASILIALQLLHPPKPVGALNIPFFGRLGSSNGGINQTDSNSTGMAGMSFLGRMRDRIQNSIG